MEAEVVWALDSGYSPMAQKPYGHGCFRKYIFERERAESNACVYCQDDDVTHTLYMCPRWEETHNQRTDNNTIQSLSTLRKALQNQKKPGNEPIKLSGS
ncbi:hypothetical protein JTB14_002232 [Gonioctena quinquepunctata]|nr:hypothetical protein JTB14_002232 [Gonioctena quinquepunctata]